jgi:beta-phosphoglucomutase-like phosphatase (HAD superfamily)
VAAERPASGPGGGGREAERQPGSVEALLFDIDGTLISTGGASDRAWHRAFLELHGVEVDVPAYTGKGVPDPEVGRQCFRAVIGREPDGDEMAKLMALRQRHLAEEVESSPGYRVMPGVVELLERLTGEGRLVGLITGNTKPAAQAKLARADLNRFFAFGGYGSDANRRVDVCRKALDRAEAAAGGRLDRGGSIAIGDTPRDVEAAHGAGIRVVSVATGQYGVEELRAAGGDWVVADLSAGGLPF